MGKEVVYKMGVEMKQDPVVMLKVLVFEITEPTFPCIYPFSSIYIDGAGVGECGGYFNGKGAGQGMYYCETVFGCGEGKNETNNN